MTQPAEQHIRAACEEAGVPRISLIGYCEGDYLPNAILALARRIAAEREAVPSAWCVACEGKPQPGVNDPCAVCGRAALQENQNVG